jgi:hypothetical protein
MYYFANRSISPKIEEKTKYFSVDDMVILSRAQMICKLENRIIQGSIFSMDSNEINKINSLYLSDAPNLLRNKK